KRHDDGVAVAPGDAAASSVLRDLDQRRTGCAARRVLRGLEPLLDVVGEQLPAHLVARAIPGPRLRELRAGKAVEERAGECSPLVAEIRRLGRRQPRRRRVEDELLDGVEPGIACAWERPAPDLALTV